MDILRQVSIFLIVTKITRKRLNARYRDSSVNMTQGRPFVHAISFILMPYRVSCAILSIFSEGGRHEDNAAQDTEGRARDQVQQGPRRK